MGTSNFHSNRTSCVFAVGGEDEWIWQDTRDNIVASLEVLSDDKKNTWEFSERNDITLHEELRSFPATSIGWFYSDFSYAGVNIVINFIPKTVSGYYEGFNLDFELQIEDDYSTELYTVDNIDEGFMTDIINEHLYQKPEAAGMIKIHGKNLLQKVKDKVDEGQKLLEDVFNMYSDGYKVAARFSNGETIYEKCEETA